MARNTVTAKQLRQWLGDKADAVILDRSAAEGGWAEVPIPPSANHLWRAVRKLGRGGQADRIRFIKNRHYKDWLVEADAAVRAGVVPVRGPVQVSVEITGGQGWRKGRDLDNAIKGLIDCLRHADRIDGDSTEIVKKVSAEFFEGKRKRPARCRVKVERYHPGAAVPHE